MSKTIDQALEEQIQEAQYFADTGEEFNSEHFIQNEEVLGNEEEDESD